MKCGGWGGMPDGTSLSAAFLFLARVSQSLLQYRLNREANGVLDSAYISVYLGLIGVGQHNFEDGIAIVFGEGNLFTKLIDLV